MKEAAETEYWLLLHAKVSIGNTEALAALTREVSEVLAILTTIKHRASRADR
jgi:hypothetical protein